MPVFKRRSLDSDLLFLCVSAYYFGSKVDVAGIKVI